MDKTKLGATGKSGGAKKAEQTSALPKLSFSYHIIKARDIQKLINVLQSVLFNEQNKNKIMRYLINEEQIKSYSIQVRKDEITHICALILSISSNIFLFYSNDLRSIISAYNSFTAYSTSF
jgi:hypothetical protein